MISDWRIVAVAAMLLLGGCNDISPYNELVAAAELGVEAVSLTPETVILNRAETQQMTFTATLDSGDERDLTTEARWLTGDSAVATVDDAGLVTAVQDGSTFVRASFGQFSAQRTIVVNTAELINLGIEGPASVSICKPTHFTLNGHYSDSTQRPIRSDATWTLEPSTAGLLDSSGTLTVTAPETTDVTLVASKDKISTRRPIDVIDDLKQIDLSAPVLEIAVKEEITLGATGIRTDGSRTDLADYATWQSQATSIAKVEPGGHIIAIEPGKTTISASCGGVKGEIAVTVLAEAKVSAIEIEKGRDEITVAQGDILQLDATAIYTDGHRAIATNDATWSAETIRGGPITVGNEKNNKGRVDTSNSGEAFIKAEYEGEVAYIKVIVQ